MKSGVFQVFCAYIVWGISPVFWKGLTSIAVVDVLGHRALWTFAVLAIYQVIRSSWSTVYEVIKDVHTFCIEVTAALLISSNWLIWIWAMNTDRVIEGSLGYFITPLVSVFIGVVFLGESLRRYQWLAIAFASIGVVWLTLSLGSLPWVSLLLAFTFGLYGLCKKLVGCSAIDGLTVEASVLFFPTLIFLILRAETGHELLGTASVTEIFLLVGSGVFTVCPLLLFANAARQVPLSVIGIVQYLSPTLNFLLGILVYEETFDFPKLLGYLIIWIGIVIFAADGFWLTRRSTRQFIDGEK